MFSVMFFFNKPCSNVFRRLAGDGTLVQPSPKHRAPLKPQLLHHVSRTFLHALAEPNHHGDETWYEDEVIKDEDRKGFINVEPHFLHRP